MNHPVRQPNTRPPAIVDPTDAFAVGQQLADLTTAQQAELQALITRAVAIATTQHLDRRTPHAAGGRGERSPLAEPGVWIVLVMLALVAVVAIVALAAV
ncbi:MAG: hypothetical protein AAGA65_30055, partial [Actinomycetota bacterium]